MLLDRSQIWEAKERAASCPDARVKARSHWALGELKDASRAYADARAEDPGLEPTVSEVEAHALGGAPERAAAVVQLMANTWYRGPDSTERRRLLCMADAFAARAERSAEARLQAVYDGARWPVRPDLECALLLADLKSDSEGRVWALQTDDDKRSLRRLIISETGKGNDYFSGTFLFERIYPLFAMKDPRAWVHLRPLAVEKGIVEAQPGTPLGGECAADLGMFYALMGDRARAAAMLAKVPERGLERTGYIVAAIAATHAGDYERAAHFMDLGREDSNAVASIEKDITLLKGTAQGDNFNGPATVEPWSPNREIFAAGNSGDGALIAAELDRLHTDARMTVLRILPRVTKNREALARWLEGRFPGPCATCGLFALAESTGTRLVLARAIGDRALEDKLAPIARTLTGAVLDRTYAMPILLLESFVR